MKTIWCEFLLYICFSQHHLSLFAIPSLCLLHLNQVCKSVCKVEIWCGAPCREVVTSSYLHDNIALA